MASGTQSAILNFPSSVDIYLSKADRGVIVSGESHLIPVLSPFQFYTTHTPLDGNPGTTTSIPGFVEVTGTPSTNQYQVDYSGNNASRFSFSSFNAGNTVAVTYTANGDEIVAEWFNSLQVSVTGIETYVLSGTAFAGNVRVTGSSMTGNLTMNGGSIATAVSGANNIGNSLFPFAEVVTNVVSTAKIQDLGGIDTITLGGDIVISGNNAVIVESNGLVQLSGSNSINILGGPSGIYVDSANDQVVFDSHLLPTGSFVYDLGASGQRWRTLYADNIVATNNPYVRVTGDQMTGSLVMATGAAIVTDAISNASNSLTVSSSSDINLNAAGVVNATASLVNLVNNLQVGSTFIGVNSPVIPGISGVYNLGSVSNKFGTIYADNIEGAVISGAFVHTTGDRMTGDLNMAVSKTISVDNITSALNGLGSVNIESSQLNVLATNNISFSVGTGLTNVFDIGISQITQAETMLPSISGLYDIGAAALPLRAIYANNLHVGNIGSGLSIDGATIGTVSFTGNVSLGSGNNILALFSGSNNIGSSGNPFGTIYAQSIVTNGSTGTFLLKFGDTMLGNLALGTGSSITVVSSGGSNIGTAASPIGTIYANNISGSNLSSIYVQKAGDTMTGQLIVPSISATGNLTISAGGFLNLTGNQITEMAQQLTLTSTVGPIIIGAQTELQLMSNSSEILNINPSGIESFADIFPDVSGTHSLGTAMKPFENIFARNIIPIGASGTGTFVLRIGDSMVGSLVFNSGASVLFGTSGVSDVGSAANPARAIYADSIVTTNPSGAFVHITGDTMTGSLTVAGGFVSVDNLYGYTVGGTLSIGSGSQSLLLDPNPFDTQYISMPSGSSIIISDQAHPLELRTSGLNTSGNIFPHQSGVTTIGTALLPYANLFATGINTQFIQTTNITNIGVSGAGLIGTATNPFLNVFTKLINGQPVPNVVYNEIPSGTINNVNITFTTAFAALSGTQRLYRAGLRMSPNSIDYSYSGSTITFVNAPISGDNLLIDYSHL